MLKKEFLESLKERLFIIDYELLMKTLEYYSEAIDDRVEDGLTEEEAVKDLGPIDEICREVLKSSKKEEVVEEKPVKLKKLNLSHNQKIILGLTAIIWGPIAFAGLMVVASLIIATYAVIWSLYLALICVNFAVGIGGVATIIGSFGYFVAGKIAMGFYYIGGGLLAIGLATLLVIVSYYASKLVFKVSKNLALFIKNQVLKVVGEKDE